MENIYIIILNYNNYKDTIECIESLNKYLPKQYHVTIVIVDNSSVNESVQQLEKRNYSNTVLLKSEKNVGYAGGNNIGICYALEQKAEYIVILNNDTIVCEDFITPCIEFLKNNSKVAFVSPAIIDYKLGVVQSTGANIDIRKGNVFIENQGREYKNLPEQIEADYIGGACMVLSTDIVKKIGNIPEAYFLFFEESEWCYRAKKKGLKNICITTTKIFHKGSASIDKIVGLHSYLMERNRVVFVKRNCNSRIEYILFLISIFFKTLGRALIKDKQYFRYLKYYFDGMTGNVDRKKYPFIIIEE